MMIIKLSSIVLNNIFAVITKNLAIILSNNDSIDDDAIENQGYVKYCMHGNLNLHN